MIWWTRRRLYHHRRRHRPIWGLVLNDLQTFLWRYDRCPAIGCAGSGDYCSAVSDFELFLDDDHFRDLRREAEAPPHLQITSAVLEFASRTCRPRRRWENWRGY
ncbi:hypothetical protein CH063_08099 [Colletotrichum higginsianum]|uniref:Uncharacterized protein n=1 Tax=Colletotrichum higginsianum (strain IMI 349063) TaxID=759273 RepID=H1V8K1_COLHI|nr:hypothetical protein CH063_08099 [Colletotrichum higginsianum]